MTKERQYPDVDVLITEEIANQYLVELQINEDWITSKDRQYSPNEASKREGRFNPDGAAAFYVASGTITAQAEVEKYAEKTHYRLKSGPYEAFDADRFSSDQELVDCFTASKEAGGWGFCQEVATRVQELIPTCSGILYLSRPRNEAGEQGHCLAIFSDSRILNDPGVFQEIAEDNHD